MDRPVGNAKMNRHRELAQMMRAAAPPGGIITDGLIHHWPFLGDLADTVGSLNGRALSGVTPTADGVVYSGLEPALTFDTDSASFAEGADAKFSLFAEFESTLSTADFYILTKYSSSTSCSASRPAFMWRRQRTPDGSRINLSVWFGGNSSIYRIVFGGLQMSLNTRYRVGVTYDGSIDTNNGADRIIHYLDGAVDLPGRVMLSAGALGEIAPNLAGLGSAGFLEDAGTRCGGNSNGLVADLRIYDRVLSESEASSITAGTG